MAFGGRRAVLSLTTRFCLPHEGMATLDYLSSGSAVVLRGGPEGASPAVVTCQHVACPWLFPRYFAATWDWLQFVREDFVRHSLQLLAVGGARPELLLELPLAARVHTHESRDLALLTLADAGAWQRAETELGLQALTLQQAPAQRGDALLFSGHRQLDEGLQLPKAVDGRFVGRSAGGQEFAWSRELLEEGIEAHAAWEMRTALAGHVAFVPAAEVRSFIDDPGNLLLTGMDLPPHM
ncbi:Trypsin-like cysteine/serine peptidase domain [Phytophthora cinnamomi]|uniref:Trypsin-like cysteine/serine peptidase domain n=1 Tax=Phytophthora cinnamomi TaxID=4785 RepID=UPI00355A4591|nr:Trypsin-like cysteine/serine peptidase domain [Phytophthora cinnamomi]